LASAASGAVVIGPDVIVGELTPPGRYTPVDPDGAGPEPLIHAFAVGTTSCNIGDKVLQWWTTGMPGGSSNTTNPALGNKHPVIAQNIYRYKSVAVPGGGTVAQFEQIGQSHLKHGFTALSQSLCSPCVGNDSTGGTLDPGCSDPYSSSLNGSQNGLGPRWQVNAWTGVYPMPPTQVTAPTSPVSLSSIWRRLWISEPDLTPALNTGATYFSEGQYISPDDAMTVNDAGVAQYNGFNNASYRRITVATTTGGYTMSNTSGFTTQRQKSAIWAWKEMDPAVTIVNMDVPSEGRFELGYRVTDLGGGRWAYEYAVRNLNSDRSGGAFNVNLGSSNECVDVTNAAFRDVRYHSGEAWDNEDWNYARTSGALQWATKAFSEDANANALRWGTMYNYRFVANKAPVTGTVTLDLFKPGTPTALTVAALVPGDCPPVCDSTDFNGDLVFPDNQDIVDFIDVFGGGACPTGTCGDIDFNNDGVFPDNADLVKFIDVFAGGAC
jgi:hypothetical protein